MSDPVITDATVREELLRATHTCMNTVIKTPDVNVAQKAAAAALDCVKALQILESFT